MGKEKSIADEFELSKKLLKGLKKIKSNIGENRDNIDRLTIKKMLADVYIDNSYKKIFVEFIKEVRICKFTEEKNYSCVAAVVAKEIKEPSLLSIFVSGMVGAMPGGNFATSECVLEYLEDITEGEAKVIKNDIALGLKSYEGVE